MERLDAKERSRLWQKVKIFYEDISDILDENESAYCASELEPKELMLIKYRIVKCIKFLQEHNLAGPIAKLKIPSIDSMYFSDTIVTPNSFFEDNWLDHLMKIINEYTLYGEAYLENCLAGSGWKVFFISELKEYESLPKDLLLKLKGSIEMHWEALNTVFTEKQKSEYLTSLGFDPTASYDFYPVYNLILTNENIKQMLEICKKNPEYKTWEEYQELFQIKDFCLLDRYFPDVSNKDLNDPDWCCISYLLGEVMTYRVEEAGLYNMTYEAVFNLMLADMVAQDFLEKYQQVTQREMRVA